MTKCSRLTVLLKVTERCGLGCTYCYAGNNGRTLPPEKAVWIIDKIRAEVGTIEILFHGGEPTILGTDYYSQVLRKLPGVEYGMQSNGMHLTDEMLDLFISAGMSFGISVDGPGDCNSHRGDSEIPARWVRRSRDKGKPIGIISVVTTANIHKLVEVYEWAKAIGASDVAFEPAFNIGPNKGGFNKSLITEMEWATRMHDLYLHWLADGERIHLRNVSYLVTLLLYGRSTLCIKHCSGARYVGVDPTGATYPCTRYLDDDPYPSGYCGNIFHDTTSSILEARGAISRAIELPGECSDCPYRDICLGGCPRTRGASPCEKELFDRISATIKSQLEEGKCKVQSSGPWHRTVV